MGASEPRTGPWCRRAGGATGLRCGYLASLVLVLVAGAALSAPPRWRGSTLGAALERLRERGLVIVYTGELVRPEMLVEIEPATRNPRRLLDLLLAPHGLRVEEAGDALLVVADPASSGVVNVSGAAFSHRGGEPLAGARIRLLELGVETSSDPAGRFAIEVPRIDAYSLEARHAGFLPARIEGLATTGSSLEVTFELVPEPFLAEEIEVRASRLALLGEEPSPSLAFERREIEALPQLGGDVLRALSLLPGVTANDLTAQPSVRGGRRDEVLILLDGQELFDAHHLDDFDGARGIVAADSLQTLTLTTGNFSSRHGDRMGAVLDMITPPPSDAPRARLGLGLLDAQAAGGGPLAAGRGGWFAAVRLGTVDLASRIFGAEDPRFGDLFAKTDQELGVGQRLAVRALVAGDRLEFTEGFGDESKRYDTEYRSGYFWATHDAVLGARTLVETRASASRFDRDRRGDEIEEEGAFLVSDRRDFEVVGLEQTWAVQLATRQSFEGGFGARVYRATYDYLNLAERELAFVSNDDSGTVVAPGEGITRFEEDFRGEHLGLFGAYRVSPADPLSLELGLRYDRHSLTGDTLWSPRASLAWRLGDNSVLRGSWGRYAQSQRPYELQVQDGERVFARAERSWHGVVGWERTFGDGDGAPLRALRIEGYRRETAQPRPRCENLVEPINVFAEVEPDRFCLYPSSSDAKGVELVLRGAAGRRGSWWLGYAYADADDRLGTRDVPRELDQRHTIDVQIGRRLGKGWQLSAAWRFHTGWPTTPARLELVDIGQDEVDTEVEGEIDDGHAVVVLGPLRSTRLSSYHRLDLRASRSWRVGPGELTFFVDVQNLYDRANVAGFDLSIDDEEEEAPALAVEEESWPGLFPSLGVILEF